jgi:hypothetical protein
MGMMGESAIRRQWWLLQAELTASENATLFTQALIV